MFASKYHYAVLYNSAIFLPWLPFPGGRLSSSGSVQSGEVRRECGCITLVVVLANGVVRHSLDVGVILSDA